MAELKEKQSEVAKKTYQSPALIEYGTLTKLTQGGGGAMADGAAATMACL